MYKCCKILKHGLCFFNDILTSCCFSPVDQIDGQVPPLLYNKYKGQILSKEDLFERINKHVDIFKKGNCLKECSGCYHIEEKDWDEEQYIDYITITHFSICNADCIYCTNNHELYERTNNTYKILPVLKSFKDQGIIKKGCELHIGGGEFTIYHECDEILDLFAINNYARVFVPTNAIRYSEKLFQAMDKATTYIIVSLDCGCRKTFHKIKRVDAFNRVINSLEKYAASKAYALDNLSIAVLADNTQLYTIDDLKGKKVAVAEGSQGQAVGDELSQEKGLQLVIFENNSGLNYLSMRRSDAWMSSKVSLVFDSKKAGIDVRIFDEDLLSTNIRYYFRKNDKKSDEKRDAVDEAIQEMLNDGTLQKISEKWFQIDVTKGL